MITFEYTFGSTTGRDHRNKDQNNQDALLCALEPRSFYQLFVVADGCGSTPSSEVGAKLGVTLLNRAIDINENYRHSLPHGSGFIPIEQVVINSINEMPSWIKMLSQNVAMPKASHEETVNQAILDTMLFTLCGVVLTPRMAIFFCWGDGELFINDEHILIESPGNAPNYPGYLAAGLPDLVGTPWIKEIPLSELETFVVATDGLRDLRLNTDRKLPGSQKLIEPVESLWTEDKYFANSDALRRYLHMASRNSVKFDRNTNTLNKETGYLKDDTTLIVGRRANAESLY